LRTEFASLTEKIIMNFIKKIILRWEYLEEILSRKNINIRIKALEKYLPKESVGAELGVFKGRFSVALLNKVNPNLLYLIDPWYLGGTKWEWATGNKSTIDALYNVLKRFKNNIDNGSVKVCVDSDIDALEKMQSNSLDWVYIDSSHEYEHTKIELDLLCKKIKKGGIIAGDDWYPDASHKHHGVYKAVQEFINLGKIELLYYGEDDKQWVTKNLCDES